MGKIVLPEPNLADAADAIAAYRARLGGVKPQQLVSLKVLSATRDALMDYRAGLQSFLDSQQPTHKKALGLTDEPPAVPATEYVGSLSNLLNSTAAIKTASPTSLPEWAKATLDDLLLMSGKTFSNEADPLNYHAARVLARMPTPALTDVPPEVTDEDVDAAASQFDLESPFGGTLRVALEADRARVWQVHRPKPADPVRFALEKVDRESLRTAAISAIGVHFSDVCLDDLIDRLARILPVAEPVKPWADLTPDKLWGFNKAANHHAKVCPHTNWHQAWGEHFITSLSAYAPPPRKVEVTPEVARAFQAALADSTPVIGVPHLPLPNNQAGALLAAFAKANEQAGAALLKEAERLEELQRLQAHADKLEAMLTVPGVDGPIKRWKVRLADSERSTVTTEPMTQAAAFKIGMVIGEAGE